jgi:hypothetical protein
MKGKNWERNFISEPIYALKYCLCEALITLRGPVVNFYAHSLFMFYVPCINQIYIFK